MSGVNEIRSSFLNFFARNDHEIVPSSPLVPRNDPTLMFTNAGMVQFKNVFTGMEKREHPRAVSSQKCVRAGGKHNDLDNVGYTARHHTFFEMLGNFSFGDYFKERAITLAWEFVTKELALPKHKLCVTVYSEDDEAHALWRKIAGLSENDIIRIPTSDNFWAMGDTGPCGPCSEIFYDHGDHIPGGPPGSADADGDRFIEIWNLVFMQYEQVSKDQRVNLPRPSIDTGMGLERIAAVMQGTHDNYETDLMRALIRACADATHAEPDGPHKASHRVIADHLRASSFLIADGVLPANEGRGYVLRRIMRRAMRHVQLIGAREPLLHKLFPALLRQMGEAYPELHRAHALITETLRLEETRFLKTLERGLAILENETKNLVKGGALSGETAFTLYDTYGFPLDLTQDALRARGISVDTAGFETAMQKQKAQARAAWSGSGDAATETLWFDLREKTGATEFLGYDSESAESTVQAIIKDGQSLSTLKAGESGIIIVNQTPFYAESGGQQGDTGTITTATFKATVTDTQKKLGSIHAHVTVVQSGQIALGDSVEMRIDSNRRSQIKANHSATHLLHEALRHTLGDHIAQKGSLVAPGRLRFDISHPKPITQEELSTIEDSANAIILQNAPVITRLMGVEEAMKSGARALFGEKYGDEVRVVSMGTRPDTPKQAYSVELCGGTHVESTGEIGLVVVTSESAVAAGVRRIEALTGTAARHHLASQARRFAKIADQLKAPLQDIESRIETLIEERRTLERELSEAKKRMALSSGNDNASGEGISTAGSTPVLSRIVSGIPLKDLKSLADEARSKLPTGIITIIGQDEDGKAGVVVAVSNDLTSRFNAVDLVRLASEHLGGKGGGGRPDMAQAGGPDGSKAQEALDAILKTIAAA